MSRIAALSLTFFVSCAAASSARPVAPTSSSMDTVVDVSSGYLAWRGEPPKTQALFAVIADEGYRALVRTRPGADVPDCDDCPGPLVAFDVVSGEVRGERLVAVGPVDGPRPRARIERKNWSAPGADWQTLIAVDIDGDGHFEREKVVRCGRWAPSGCKDRVCNEWCFAIRDVGRDVVDGVSCQGFIPDVEDCAP